MIEIIKTKCIVNQTEFFGAVKSICLKTNKYKSNVIGLIFPTFKRELGLKITELQFFNLCEEVGISVRRGIIFFEQFGIVRLNQLKLEILHTPLLAMQLITSLFVQTENGWMVHIVTPGTNHE